MAKKLRPRVAVIMGSESDLPAMAGAKDVLESAMVEVELRIVSAHRTPEYMQEYATNARDRGIEIIIAGAGGAAHLPGMVASLTTLPVIGVPVTVGKLEALDAILSIVQMPKGVPVATVGADNSANAGLLALRVLAIKYPKIAEWLNKHRKSQQTRVKKANHRLKK